jgi:hypothetical protein
MLGGVRFKNKGSGPELREIVGFNPNVTSLETANHRKTDAWQATGALLTTPASLCRFFRFADVLGEEL